MHLKVLRANQVHLNFVHLIQENARNKSDQIKFAVLKYSQTKVTIAV